MHFQVRLTQKALRDAEAVLSWFHQQQADVAGAKWFSALMAKIDTLQRQPQRCPVAVEAAELGIDLRELHFGRRQGTYRILFIIDKKTVEILHIRHAARDTVGPEDL